MPYFQDKEEGVETRTSHCEFWDENGPIQPCINFASFYRCYSYVLKSFLQDQDTILKAVNRIMYRASLSYSLILTHITVSTFFHQISLIFHQKSTLISLLISNFHQTSSIFYQNFEYVYLLGVICF